MADAPHTSPPAQAPQLLRLQVPLPPLGADVWHLGALCEPIWGPWVAQWSDPQEGLELCALGTALRVMLPAAGRFDAARQILHSLQKGNITLPGAPGVEGPLMLCACTFEDGACGRPGPFAGIGGGFITVPSCLLVQQTLPLIVPAQHRNVYAVLQMLVPKGDDDGRAQSWQTLQAWGRRLQRIAQQPQAGPRPDSGVAVHWPKGGLRAQQDFEQQVSLAQRALGPELSKVVVARSQEAPMRVDVQATALALRENQGRATAFAVALPGHEHFLGATPETLIRLADGAWRSEALAGTHSLGIDPAGDALAQQKLLASAKDRHEHDTVVRGAVAALAPYSEPIVVPHEPQALRLKHMWHLRTPLAGRTRGAVDALGLAQALHPTAALGGMPTHKAQEHLLHHEPWRRGLYAAPLGVMSLNGDGVFVAGIRSMWCDAERATLFAGAGIVPASVPHQEWHETCLKLTTVAQALHVLSPEPELLSTLLKDETPR